MALSYTGNLRWYSLARAILTYVNDNTTSRFERVTVTPGLIAWDSCDCGALYLMVNQNFDCEVPPNQKVEVDPSMGCAAPYEGAEFVLQVMQCAPSPQGQSIAPTVKAEDEASRLVRRDAYEVRKAVREFLCTAEDARDVEWYIIDTQIVQGPSGGCVGTELRFRVGLQFEG
jgi:hypothetical protein